MLAFCAPAAASTLQTLTVPSSCVDPQRVPMSDPPAGKPARPAALRVNVLLPDGYDGQRRFPVLYLLHGLGGAYDYWLDASHGELRKTVDALPRHRRHARGRNRRDLRQLLERAGDVAPCWERYYLDELIPEINRRYPHPCRQALARHRRILERRAGSASLRSEKAGLLRAAAVVLGRHQHSAARVRISDRAGRRRRRVRAHEARLDRALLLERRVRRPRRRRRSTGPGTTRSPSPRGSPPRASTSLTADPPRRRASTSRDPSSAAPPRRSLGGLTEASLNRPWAEDFVTRRPRRRCQRDVPAPDRRPLLHLRRPLPGRRDQALGPVRARPKATRELDVQDRLAETGGCGTCASGSRLPRPRWRRSSATAIDFAGRGTATLSCAPPMAAGSTPRSHSTSTYGLRDVLADDRLPRRRSARASHPRDGNRRQNARRRSRHHRRPSVRVLGLGGTRGRHRGLARNRTSPRRVTCAATPTHAHRRLSRGVTQLREAP